MRSLLIAVISVGALSGCATNPARWENRVVCTIDRSEAHFIRKWWGFSIGSMIAKADGQVLCGVGANKP